MNRTFDKYEDRGAYHWEWHRRRRSDYLDLLNRSLPLLEPPGTILDVGCGDGLCSYLLFQKGFRVVGIDTSECAIRLARSMTRKAFVRERAWWYLPLRWHLPSRQLTVNQFGQGLRFEIASLFDTTEGPVDQLLMQEVIEHLTEPRAAIEKVATLIREFAVITTPNADYMKPHTLDYHTWNASQFMELFSGFDAQLIHRGRRLIVKLFAAPGRKRVQTEES